MAPGANKRPPRGKKPKRPAASEVVDAEVVEDAPARSSAPSPARAAGPGVVPEVEAAPEPLAEAEAEPDLALEAGAEPEELTGLPEVAPAPARKPTPGLVSRDPLQAYMAEVTKHQLLTREEEVALARRYRETGDVKAAYTLVAANLRLVVKLAHEYHRNPLALLDLIQEGNMGLMQAVKKFDPERGVKLSSYAAWWIRAYILRYIMDNWKMVKLGTTEAQRKLFFKLRQEQDKLASQGVEVTPRLLAERLDVTEQDVVEMDQRLGRDEVSIDAPIDGGDSPRTQGDRLLQDRSPGVEEALGSAELKQLFQERVAEFAETLNEKERFIFDKRLMSEEPLTLADVGAHYGFSRERARQIEAALISRMRTYMREKIPDFDLVAIRDG